MARIRSIKPGFFTSEDVAELSLRARLTWIGLWTYADDEGRAKDNVRLIKGAVWPLDPTSLTEIEEDLSELAAAGRIVRYEVEGKRFFQVANWGDHQRPNRPSASQIPAFTERSNGRVNGTHEPSVSPHGAVSEPSVKAHGAVTENARAKTDTPPPDGLTEPSVSTHGALTAGGEGEKEGNRRGNARDPNPSPRCPQHQGVHNPPACPACGDARRAYDATLRADKSRPTTVGLPPAADAPRCEVEGHEHELASNCRICAADALEGPPDVDPEQEGTT